MIRHSISRQYPSANNQHINSFQSKNGKSVLRTALLLAMTGSAPWALGQDAGNTWTTPSGSLEGTRYSTLSQIDSTNIGRLTEEFAYSTGIKASHEGGALAVDGIMYVVGPYPNRLYAFDLGQGGKLLWTYKPSVSEWAKGVACCDVVNHGASYANGKIIYNLLDDTTVAVDAKTGQQVWRTKVGDPHTGQTITMAPLIVKDKVIIGNSGAELGIRGWVLALDVNTGKQLWKAYNTGPDSEVKIGKNFHAHYAKDQGQDLGANTWGSSIWKQGGATSWGWFSYDPDLNLVYYGTANPGVWNPDMRPGDNKWASSIVARNPDTGEAVWAYQVTPHDNWDYDSMNESIVTTQNINGVNRKVIVHFDKNGYGYTLDAATGEVLVAKPYVDVTWSTGVDLSTGEPQVLNDKLVHEGTTTEGICPSALGGKEFVPAAYSGATGLFYIPGVNFCQKMHALKAMYIAGAPFMGIDLGLAPGAGGYGGELIAWNAATGQRQWNNTEKYPIYSGVLATAGNLVFYGTLDKHFKALDATTGKVLLDKPLPCGVTSNPNTFVGPDGKQRVALMTGVGYLAGGVGAGTCGGAGAGVHVFKLP